MLSPKRTKFRKPHRGRFRGTATRGNQIVFGDYALQALEPVWLTSRQIEATRRSITRFVKRTGKLWIRVFPDKSISCKPPETRMGSGKGAPDYWVAVIKPGSGRPGHQKLVKTVPEGSLSMSLFDDLL